MLYNKTVSPLRTWSNNIVQYKYMYILVQLYAGGEVVV